MWSITRIAITRILQVSCRQWLIRHFRYPYGRIDFGDLCRTRPISRVWGLDRGVPVDRYYIERFLGERASDVCGRVLEIGDNTYTLGFGGNRVVKSDILHISAASPKCTIVADLAYADHIASDLFDCIICTQTLHLIYKVESAILTLHRILKPGGVLLATLPGISQISRYDMDRWGDYWRFTSRSVSRLFAANFAGESMQISVYGNVLSAVAFLQGISSRELSGEDLDVFDPDYEVLIAVRARKAEADP